MKRTIVLLAAFMLCACAGPLKEVGLVPKDEFTPQIEKWVGRSADDLVASKGVPVNVYQLEEGRRLYEYYGRTLAPKDSMKGSMETGLRQLYTQDSPIPVAPAGTDTAQPEIRRKVVKPKDLKCMVTFSVGADNIIKGWTSEGGGCK